MLDPREKARRDKQREVDADLKNAADLLGAAALGGTLTLCITAIAQFDDLRKCRYIL